MFKGEPLLSLVSRVRVWQGGGPKFNLQLKVSKSKAGENLGELMPVSEEAGFSLVRRMGLRVEIEQL